MEVLAFILRAIEPIGASVWPARPACLSRTCRANRAHDFARVFRVRLLCRVVDTEALRDRCGRCRALDCSQDSGASDLVGEICMEAFVRPLQQDAKYIDTLGMHTPEKWPTS